MGGMEQDNKCDVCVIGGGPAGLMNAIVAATAGAAVILLEQLPRCGVKLLSTGGGRCNLTNTLPEDEFMAAFGRYGRFMQPALAALGSEALCGFFATLGVPTHAPDGIHVYPVSNSAATVQAALVARCRELGVRVITGQPAEKLTIANGAVAGVATPAGRIDCRRVVLATGGRSYPGMGGTGGGYALAKHAGHDIVALTPALVGLIAKEDWPGRCAGISLPNCRVCIDGPGKKASATGDVLFTHVGLSGPAILDISGDVAVALRTQPTVTVALDLTGLTQAGLLAKFDQWQRRAGTKSVAALVAERVPARLVEVLCRQAGVAPDVVAAHMLRPERQALARLLSRLTLTIKGVEGFDHAMVTRGGVSLKQVNPHTLESKVTAGLFFAGEVLDLDGPCGGFNLQWAFASGYLAGLQNRGSGEQVSR
jgi:predicted Rossmann fold flavoprotein